MTDKIIAHIDPELEEIIPMFFEQSWEEIHALQGALKNGDYDTIKRYGHGIKGSSLGYGFEAMGDIGLQIEDAAIENKSLDEIKILVDQLVHYVENVEVMYDGE